MRDRTFIYRNGIQQTELMQTESGIKTILVEIGLWPTDQSIKLLNLNALNAKLRIIKTC